MLKKLLGMNSGDARQISVKMIEIQQKRGYYHGAKSCDSDFNVL